MNADKVDDQITVWSKRFALVLIGWFAHSASIGSLTLHQHEKQLVQIQKVELPKLKAAVHCEDKRADKAAAVAGQAILSANVEAVPTPKFSDLPTDNCPHPAGK